MGIRKIASIGDQVLRQQARRVSREELAAPATQRLIDDLIECLHETRASGLSACQLGEPLQICVIGIPTDPRFPEALKIPLAVLVNPVVEPIGEERFPNYEGCLSVPNLRGAVPRACVVYVRAWNRDGREIDYFVRGLAAAAYQHEFDHLAGALYIDRVRDPSTLCSVVEYDRCHAATSAERAQALVARFGS